MEKSGEKKMFPIYEIDHPSKLRRPRINRWESFIKTDFYFGHRRDTERDIYTRSSN